MESISGQGQFSLQDLDDINLGAHFLACGGGGALENGEALLEETKNAMKQRGVDSIGVVNPKDFPDDAWLPVLAAMGAPQEFLEKGYGKSPVSAFREHERLIQIRMGNPDFSFSAVIPVETGSIAHTMSLLVAAKLGLPVIDGDGCGRATPTLQMTSFANPETEANIHVSPCQLSSEETVNQGGMSLAIVNDSATDVDNLSRAVLSGDCGYDNRASLSSFAMTGAQLKIPNVLVHGTYTKARDLGRGIRECIAEKADVFEYVEKSLGAALVCEGSVARVESTTKGGFDWLNVYIEGNDNNLYTVIAKNENMMIWAENSGTPLVMAPDLICYLQRDGTALSNSEIETRFKQGAAISLGVFSIRAAEAIDNAWIHQEFGEVFKSYGYYGAYHPPIVNGANQ